MKLGVFVLIAVTLIYVLLWGIGPGMAEEAVLSAATAPSLWVTPLVLDFGPVGVGETSDPQVVTIENVGNNTLTNFAGGGVNAPFGATQNCAGGVPPGGSCQYTFTFAPTGTGMFTATSRSSSNAGSFAIELHGEGVGAGLHVTPLSLDFGSVLTDTTSAQQIVTIRNTGLSTLTNFAGGGVNLPFGATQNCAGGVLPGDSCQYFFSFSPATSGTFTATSRSSSNAGLFSIDLQGRGRTNIIGSGQRVTPRSLNFGPVGVDLSGGTQVVTITNQSWFLSITNWAGGGVSPPFGASQNCAGGVSPHNSCQFSYTFDPTATGVFTTVSNVYNSAGSFSIALRGEGVGAGLSVSPLTLDFGPVLSGTTGVQQAVTIRNTGLSTLTNFAGGGVNAPFSASQNCAGGVPPGETCQYFYNFSPTETGFFTATSRSGTNAGSFSILLKGGVVAPHLSQSFTPDQIPPGDTAGIHYTIHNPNKGTTLFDVGFGNTFPAGMSVAVSLIGVSGKCGSPTVTAPVGATSITFTNAVILSGDDCDIFFSVTAADIGMYTNTTDPVTAASGSGNAASATLMVGARLYLPMVLRQRPVQ